MPFATACVSIDIGKNRSKKSDDVQFAEPSEPFRENEVVHLDKSWRHEKNGGTISFLSDCGNSADPSLKAIFNGVTSEIENVAVIESNEVIYNSREALHSTVEGKVDGVPTRFELIIFKKNSCLYILTYAAVANSFSANQKEFQKFVKRFVVP